MRAFAISNAEHMKLVSAVGGRWSVLFLRNSQRRGPSFVDRNCLSLPAPSVKVRKKMKTKSITSHHYITPHIAFPLATAPEPTSSSKTESQ